MNSSLHGSFNFNKFYQRHELASIEIKGTHECLAYYRSDQRQLEKKSAVKSNQQGLETSYKMTKGPELHHAQQSLTHLIQV
jgi:hypothetical protein